MGVYHAGRHGDADGNGGPGVVYPHPHRLPFPGGIDIGGSDVSEHLIPLCRNHRRPLASPQAFSRSGLHNGLFRPGDATANSERPAGGVAHLRHNCVRRIGADISDAIGPVPR